MRRAGAARRGGRRRGAPGAAPRGAAAAAGGGGAEDWRPALRRLNEDLALAEALRGLCGERARSVRGLLEARRAEIRRRARAEVVAAGGMIGKGERQGSWCFGWNRPIYQGANSAPRALRIRIMLLS